MLLDEPRFAAMQAEEGWPQVATIDETRGPVLVPEKKGSPHAAAVFSAYETTGSAAATLRVVPAVFLPLAEIDWEQRCEGRLNYELLLHGNYFVDWLLEARLGQAVESGTAQARYASADLPALEAFATEAALRAADAVNLRPRWRGR